MPEGKSQLHTDRYGRFVKRLVQSRIDSGLTQSDVAKKLGKPQSYVSKCELGERRVDFTELEAFAEIYDKQLDYFRTDFSHAKHSRKT